MISGQYDPQAEAYDHFILNSKYERDEGLLVLPLASAGTGTAADHKIITVHAPYGRRQVDFQTKKYGSPPLIPAHTTTPSGDIPLSSELVVAMPGPGSGQADYVFKAAGRYNYVQPVPRGADNSTASLNTGWYPFNPTLIIMQLIGFLAGGAGIAALDNMKTRKDLEADQETNADDQFKKKGLDFRYYSPNYPSKLFSGDLIR
jgi:hypothetical protein